MHYYQFNIKTYIASTAHLTNGEDLAYRRLIDHYYDTELPIPTALPLLCRRLRLDLPDVESVLNEFFIECEDGWRHSYIDNEIKAYKTFIARQKANGSKGGRASSANANPPLTQTEPTAKPTSNNKQRTINKEQERESVAKAPRPAKKCPADFLITDSMKDWAIQQNITIDIQSETDKLKDYTFSRVITDWHGAWRNWMRKAQEYANKSKPPDKPYESPYSKSMREKYEQITPLIAAKNPNLKKIDPNEFIYGELKNEPKLITG